jgi:site-specific DNA recombinase
VARMTKQQVRCAVYTRKSSEEGLEQSFNSLEAQREACLAYINSQKHEGWIAANGRYDDGGFSGDTMERPALKQLLDHIAAGKICHSHRLQSRSFNTFVGRLCQDHRGV